MEHALHLATKHFIQMVALHHKKLGTSAGDDGDAAEYSSEGNEGNDEAIDAGDSLRKAITLVKQVSGCMALLISELTYVTSLQVSTCYNPILQPIIHSYIGLHLSFLPFPPFAVVLLTSIQSY